MVNLDLRGGEAKVIGNLNDIHTFRLNNPLGQELISSEGLYEAEFVFYLGSTPVPVQLNLAEVAQGILSFTLTISNGIYRIRRLNPKRTILTIQVEAR